MFNTIVGNLEFHKDCHGVVLAFLDDERDLMRYECVVCLKLQLPSLTLFPISLWPKLLPIGSITNKFYEIQ